jgi:putative sigma-54 modulation protein
MQLSVTFKNIDPSDDLKAYLDNKLSKLDKFLDNPAEANAVLSLEKFRKRAEINLVGDKLTINAKEETEDMYAAIDVAVDKLEKQLKKTKEKIKDYRIKIKGKNFNEDFEPSE